MIGTKKILATLIIIITREHEDKSLKNDVLMYVCIIWDSSPPDTNYMSWNSQKIFFSCLTLKLLIVPSLTGICLEDDGPGMETYTFLHQHWRCIPMIDEDQKSAINVAKNIQHWGCSQPFFIQNSTIFSRVVWVWPKEYKLLILIVAALLSSFSKNYLSFCSFSNVANIWIKIRQLFSDDWWFVL